MRLFLDSGEAFKQIVYSPDISHHFSTVKRVFYHWNQLICYTVWSFLPLQHSWNITSSQYFAFLNSSDFWTGPSVCLWIGLFQRCVISFLHCCNSMKINEVALTYKWRNTLPDQTHRVYFAHKTINNGFKELWQWHKPYFCTYNPSCILMLVLVLMENEWIFCCLVRKLLVKVRLRNVFITLYSTNLHVSYMDRELITYRNATISKLQRYKKKKKETDKMLLSLKPFAVSPLTLLALGIYCRDLLLYLPQLSHPKQCTQVYASTYVWHYHILH